MGTTSGEPREVERFDDLFVGKKLERVGPEFLALYPSHVIAAHIARELRFAGVNIMIPTACAAGNYAIAHAFDVLRAGRASLMLAGGSDSFSRITYTGFAQLGAIAPEVCQPFDRCRKGMIPGEGAGVLVLEPLSQTAVAQIAADVMRAEPDETLLAMANEAGGNPFLLESLAAALRAADAPPAGLAAQAASLGPEQVARFVRQRADQIGAGASGLARALAVFGGPARLRHAAALAGLDLRDAARLADSLRAADVLAPGSMLEFGHPIVRAAIYESIPPGERALAHGQVAQLLDADGADAERQAPHLLRSEPAGDQRVVAVLREAARAASGRGSPGTAADYLRRALDEPPGPAVRPAVLLDLGLSLAGERSPASAGALRDAVQLATCPAEHATAALLTAEVLGIWGHHDAVAGICLDALATGDSLDPVVRGNLEAELFANSICDPSMASKTLASARRQLAEPGASSRWRVHAAFASTVTGRPASEALDRLAPVLAAGLGDIPPDSLTAAFSLMVLIWTDEFGTASRICDAVLHSARERGSMSMVAHTSCSRSMLMRRLGYLEDAAEDGQLALDFKLATSPPVAVAWAAAACIDALTGRPASKPFPTPYY